MYERLDHAIEASQDTSATRSADERAICYGQSWFSELLNEEGRRL